MPSSAKQVALAEVFAEDSEHESTFYGFSDSEIDGHNQVGHVVSKRTYSDSDGLRTAFTFRFIILWCFCLFLVFSRLHLTRF